MRNTAESLAGRRTSENAFLTCVLPRAMGDDLILHCVLALSSSHQCYGGEVSEVPEYNWDYAIALRTLGVELETLGNKDHTDYSRLLLASLLLATYEVSQLI